MLTQSSMSIRSFSRFGSSISVFGLARFGTCLSLRCDGKVGGKFSVEDQLIIGKPLSISTKLAFPQPANTYISATSTGIEHYVSGVKVLSMSTDSGVGKGTLHGLWEYETPPSVSDLRLKRDVNLLEATLSTPGPDGRQRSVPDIVRELRPVSYRLKRSTEGKHPLHFGFVAQELEKVLPEVVYTEKESGLRLVMYQDLLAVLALALKAQDHEMRSLRADVDRMKVELAEVKAALWPRRAHHRDSTTEG
jgi:hypothetical protein